MTIAVTNTPLHAICNYRPAPVATPFGRWRHIALVCSHRERENRCYWDAINTTRDIGIPVTRYFATPYRKVTTLIPITLLPSMTAWLPPAVSSLEACQMRRLSRELSPKV